MASDLSTLMIPQLNPVNLNFQGLNVQQFINGNINYPSDFVGVVSNTNPQPLAVNLTSFGPGLQKNLALNQQSYFSLNNGSSTLPTGTAAVVPTGYSTSSLNMSGYNGVAGILTIGITGYYKIDFSATLNVPASTVLSGVCKYGIAHSGIGVITSNNFSSVANVANIQVIPISNSAIVKLTAGFQMILNNSMTSNNSIPATDISWNFVLLDSVSP